MTARVLPRHSRTGCVYVCVSARMHTCHCFVVTNEEQLNLACLVICTRCLMMMRPDGTPGSCVCKHPQSVPDDLPDTRSGRGGGTHTSNDTVEVITSLKIIIREGWLRVITRNTAEMISVERTVN